jgi:putative Holliday junction resolvase
MVVATEAGRVMALDVGDVRTGVAFSDPDRRLATPHSVIAKPSREATLAVIQELAETMAASLVVVGLPLEEDGAEGRQARRVRAFAELLRARLTVPLVFEDERYTSLAAHEALAAAGVKARDRRGKVDMLAAADILRAYLARKTPHTGEPA